MSSRRFSFGRMMLVALLVLIALFLLELDQFLPGSWPGGGGDRGSRSLETGSKPDPSKLVRSPAPALPPKPREPGTLRVIVRRTDGTAVETGTVSVGAKGRGPSADLREGEAVIRVAPALADEAVVSVPGVATVAHGRGPNGGDGTWIVVLPKSPTPEILDSAARDGTPFGSGTSSPPPTLRVESDDGRPLVGAVVAATGQKGERRVESDAKGETHWDLYDGVQRYCVSAPGFGETCVYARVSSRVPTVVTLSPTRTRRTTFVDPDTGATLRARTLQLIDRVGSVRRLEREGESFDRFETDMPDVVAEETTLEIDVSGRPPVRVSIASLGSSTPIPAGAPRTVRMLDEQGEPVAGATVTARYAAATASENASTRAIETTTSTDTKGFAFLSLPIDRDTDLVVDAPTFAIEGLRIPAKAPLDAPAVDVRATRGTDVRVVVRDETGAPIAGADVLVLTVADRSTARRHATTNSDGEATAGGIRPGRMEVLVHRAGFAWASATATAAANAPPVTLTLRAGRRLTLVVEDPEGVPLVRVAVRSVPREESGAPGVPDPWDPDARPWETDESGVLVMEDLADREVDVYLSKAGYQEEVIAKLKPGPSTWFATMVAKPVENSVAKPVAEPRK